MAGLVFLLVFWVLAGACQRHGVGGFLLCNTTTTCLFLFVFSFFLKHEHHTEKRILSGGAGPLAGWLTCVYTSGFCILVRLLHELLLPWFAVRNALRCNDHEMLDWSWRYFVPLFRATNKHQYAAYGVQQAAAVHMMCPSVRRVWDEHRTASMTGRPGRNVAWDYVLEKMNLSYKQYLCGTITEERLNEFGVMINALRHIRKQFEQAWRHGAGDPDDEDAPGEYSHVKDADVKVLVDALKAHLGGTKDEADEKAAAFADADRTNPFSGNQRLLLPWDKITAQGMPHLRAHCIHFSNLPPQTY